MNKIRWMTDTTSDITPAQAEELGIELMSIPIAVNGQGFYEGRDFTPQQFYQILLENKELPVTSRITAPTFLEAYRRIATEGCSDLIHVTINGSGSGTYEAAQMAAVTLQKEDPELARKMTIHLFDSRSYSYGYGYAVLEGARRSRRGEDLEDLLTFVNDWLRSQVIHLACFNLDFAKRSGRINSTAAFVGELLGLRPIIRMADGGNEVVQKVRGDKNIVPAVCDISCRTIVKGGEYYIMKGMLDDPAEELSEMMKKRLGYPPKGILNLGPSVSINAGPKAVATVVRGKRRG